MTELAIELENVSKHYRTDQVETIALKDVSLTVEQGEMVSIMGPSGCGKSTLMNIMGLLDQPTGGAIRIKQQAIHDFADARLARFRNQHIGFVFQSFHLVPDLSVRDNVEIPLLYSDVSSAERRKRAEAALNAVGLTARMRHFPTQLSGGQQQRVAIARAIVTQPDVLLADEPTGNLDSHMGDEVMEILRGLNTERNTTVVMVTHDKEKAEQTDRVVRIFDGQLVS